MNLNNIYLVRHGESKLNQINRFAGSIDTPLSDLGISQAESANKVKVDLVISSPQLRAYQTAGAIFGEFNHLDDRLVERRMGSFEGQNKSILQRKLGVKRYDKAMYADDEAMVNGETMLQVNTRINSFMDELSEISKTQKVAIVAHKYIIERIARILLNDNSEFDLRLPNAKVMRATELSSYVKGQSESKSRVNDFITINFAEIIATSLVVGLCIPTVYSGLMYPMLFIASLWAGMTAAFPVTHLPETLFRMAWRYIALPLSALLLSPGLAMLLAAPGATASIMASKTMGGTGKYALLAVIIPCVIFASIGGPYVMAITIGLVLIPIAMGKSLQYLKPIQTASIGNDYSAIAVIAISVFVISAASNASITEYLLFAFEVSLILRLLSYIASGSTYIYSADLYITSAMPNLFLLAAAGYVDLAMAMMVPTFGLSILDRIVMRVIDKRAAKHIIWERI